jgi:hypothetical protein
MERKIKPAWKSYSFSMQANNGGAWRFTIG